MTNSVIPRPFIDRAPQLDGWTYRPSPHIEPDTRTGFDIDGNYHALESGRRRQGPAAAGIALLDRSRSAALS